MSEEKIKQHIDNIEQDFRLLDNIFKCIEVYWKGDAAVAVQDRYTDIKEDISDIRSNLLKLKESL